MGDKDMYMLEDNVGRHRVAVAGLKNSRDATARGRRTGCLPFSAAGQSAPILGSADVSGSQRSVCTTAAQKLWPSVKR